MFQSPPTLSFCATIDPAPFENRNLALADAGTAARWTLGTIGAGPYSKDVWLLQVGSSDDYIAWIMACKHGQTDGPYPIMEAQGSHIWCSHIGDLNRYQDAQERGEPWEILASITSWDLLWLVRVTEGEALEAYRARVQCLEQSGDPWIIMEQRAQRDYLKFASRQADQHRKQRKRAQRQGQPHQIDLWEAAALDTANPTTRPAKGKRSKQP